MTDKMLSEAEIALEPCPLCGGKASFGTLKYGPGNAELIELNGQDTFYSVNCQHCPGQVQGIIGHKSKDDAAKAWNKRPKPACQYCEDKGTFPAEKMHSSGDYWVPFIETCSCAAGKSLQEKNAPKPRQDAGRVELEKAWGDAAHEAIEMCKTGNWQDFPGSDSMVDAVVDKLKKRAA